MEETRLGSRKTRRKAIESEKTRADSCKVDLQDGVERQAKTNKRVTLQGKQLNHATMPSLANQTACIYILPAADGTKHNKYYATQHCGSGSLHSDCEPHASSFSVMLNVDRMMFRLDSRRKFHDIF